MQKTLSIVGVVIVACVIGYYVTVTNPSLRKDNLSDQQVLMDDDMTLEEKEIVDKTYVPVDDSEESVTTADLEAKSSGSKSQCEKAKDESGKKWKEYYSSKRCGGAAGVCSAGSKHRYQNYLNASAKVKKYCR